MLLQEAPQGRKRLVSDGCIMPKIHCTTLPTVQNLSAHSVRKVRPKQKTSCQESWLTSVEGPKLRLSNPTQIVLHKSVRFVPCYPSGLDGNRHPRISLLSKILTFISQATSSLLVCCARNHSAPSFTFELSVSCDTQLIEVRISTLSLQLTLLHTDRGLITCCLRTAPSRLVICFNH